ncbi:MAG: hypothetical protein AABX66_00980 [Nanoarchaeota archaeon]
MTISIHNLIATINPDLFCDSEAKSAVKKLKKTKGIAEATKEAKIKSSSYMDFIEIVHKNASALAGIKSPIEKHTLSYDSFGEGLEAVYFWLLDKMGEDLKVDKITDNFVASPGSNHFGEMGIRMSKMQEEASKMLGAANTVVKSILNIVYDLKEFQTRLGVYDRLNSKEKSIKDAALLSLKQIWMDTVDIKRGNSSIKALALSQQGGFVTLIDAFMAAEDESLTFKGQEMDLNERIKRIIQQRIVEFNIWLKESEKELRKRFEIEKTYLKSQVSTVQLYARWAKPYLRAAKKLEQSENFNGKNEMGTATLVNSFNTALFELVLLGEGKYNPADDISNGELPPSMRTLVKEKKVRTYHQIVLVEFNFRTIPERTQQGYGFRGRVDITFTSYALNDDEIKLLRKQIEKDDINDVLGLIEGATTESLSQLQLDIDSFLGSTKEEEKEEEKEDTNPFSALFSSFSDLFESKKNEEKKKSAKEESEEIKPDSYMEEILRSQALIDARKKCYRLYDSYKRAHKMPSLPGYA